MFPKEDLHSLGGAWGPGKGMAMDRAYTIEGAGGDRSKDLGRGNQKRSVRRVAQSAEVSESFARSVRGYDTRFDDGEAEYGNHEGSKVAKLLKALKYPEEDFLRDAAKYAETYEQMWTRR